MDSPMDTEISVTLEEPKRKRLRQFNKAWLQDPIFKDWLKSSPNGDRALCSICDGDLFNSRSALLHHVTSMRHTDNYKIRYGKRPSASVDESKTISDVKLKMRLETLKMELSAFFAKRDVQIAIVDDLIPLLDRFYYGSKLLDKYVKTKKESTKITVKSSGTEKDSILSKILREYKFSVLIDENIPIIGKKLPCVLVKFMTPDRRILKQCFELTELDGRTYSTSILFAAFKTAFEKQNIPLCNIVSLTSNNASVMFEKRDSFVNRLKELAPNPVVLNCISGSSALIASMACAQIPVLCCQFLNSVSLYLSTDSLTSENILPLLTINVGSECQKFLDNCALEIVSKVKSNCLKFYKVATLEMINRLPYCDEFMSKLQFLNPEIALSKEIRLTFGNLNLLCERFNLMHLVHVINMEWIYVAHAYDDAEIEHLLSLPLENMWSKIFELKHSCGLPVFKNLQELVDLILILPHSNAEANHLFSNVTK
ncbi:hypothetical protein PV325_012459 [Microctonus aethiopoides]|nr:hypothetical protein PV325_012459 [Microctonus aethiopoides]